MTTANNLLRKLLASCFVCLTSVTAVPAGAAAAFPDHPIRLVVGFPPGGGADFVARETAMRLGQALGTSVVVDNRPGANGVIAAAEVARSAADGYTLLLGVSASQSISPVLMRKLPYDPQRDFTPISEVGFTPLVLVVNPALPARTVSEFIAYVKSSEEPITYGSAGIGNVTHMAAELFVQSVGTTNMRHIPYKGSTQVITDLMGGRIGAYFDTLPSSLPFIQNKQLRALAVTSPQRASAALDIPTMLEAGVPGYVATTWFGLFAPPGLSTERATRLNQALRSGFSSPEARQGLTVRGVEPVLDTPDHFRSELDADIARWREVTRKANIVLDQ